MHFISVIITSAPPQIIRPEIPEVGDPCYTLKKNRVMSLGGHLPKALGLPRPTGLRSQKADPHDFGGIFQSLLPGGDALTEMEFQGSTWG